MSRTDQADAPPIAKYGRPRDVVWSLPSIEFPPLSERPRGEVCMAIMRPNGTLLLQTKRSYPGGVMRLPTGGVQTDEDLETALLREIWEETNLTVTVDAYVASIGYRAGDRVSHFRTHLFFVRELTGELMSNDPHEAISAWDEAAPASLRDYAQALRAIDASWRDWGEFRAAALEVLADHLLGAGD